MFTTPGMLALQLILLSNPVNPLKCGTKIQKNNANFKMQKMEMILRYSYLSILWNYKNMKIKEIITTLIGVIIGGIMPIISNEVRETLINNWRIICFFIGLLFIIYALLSMFVRKLFKREVKENFDILIKQKEAITNENKRLIELYHTEANITHSMIKILLNNISDKNKAAMELYSNIEQKTITFEEIKISRIIPSNIIEELNKIVKEKS